MFKENKNKYESYKTRQGLESGDDFVKGSLVHSPVLRGQSVIKEGQANQRQQNLLVFLQPSTWVAYAMVKLHTVSQGEENRNKGQFTFARSVVVHVYQSCNVFLSVSRVFLTVYFGLANPLLFHSIIQVWKVIQGYLSGVLTRLDSPGLAHTSKWTLLLKKKPNKVLSCGI